MGSFEVKAISYPAFCKGYDEFSEFCRDYEKILKRYKAWIKTIKSDIQAETLPADIVIRALLDKAEIQDCEQYVSAAYNRYRIGNPPEKDNKYGDAINWECLLACVPDGEDLYFISADKDYKSVLSENEFNPFLKDEWSRKKNSKIYFYKDLFTFLNEHVEDIRLQTEEEKQGLIDQLAESCNFMSTHGIIAMLRKYSGWTEDQIEKLCMIAEENSQVAWILTDDDVNAFYHELVKGIDYNKLEDSATKRIIDELVFTDLEEKAQAAADGRAEAMDALENYYNH